MKKQKEKIDWKIVVTALGCITLLEAMALAKGIDGILLTSVIGIIAGIVGWTSPQLKFK